METWGYSEWRWSYLHLIRPTGCYQVSIPSGAVVPRLLRSRRRAHAAAGPGKRQRAANRTASGIPGLACILASFTPPPVRSSMSSQYPHLRRRQTPARVVRCPVACTSPQIAPQAHRCMPSRQIQPSRRQQFAGCCPLRGRLFNLTYSPGGCAWRMLHSGRLSLCAPNGGQQTLLSSTQLRCSFAAAH